MLPKQAERQTDRLKCLKKITLFWAAVQKSAVYWNAYKQMFCWIINILFILLFYQVELQSDLANIESEMISESKENSEPEQPEPGLFFLNAICA